MFCGSTQSSDFNWYFFAFGFVIYKRILQLLLSCRGVHPDGAAGVLPKELHLILLVFDCEH